MTVRTAERIAAGLFATAVVLCVAGLVMAAVAGSRSTPVLYVFAIPTIAIVYTGSGAILARRLPSNPIGWIVIAIGFFQALNLFLLAYADLALGRSGNPLPLGEIAVWAGGWTWIPSVGMLVTFLLLLFPDGHPPSPRWRFAGWIAGFGIGTAIVGKAAADWTPIT